VVSRAELTEVNEGRGIEDEYVYLDMRHLGEDRILDRLENILHLAEDFEGVDGLIEPMPVKPGQHYHMGGIETNEHGETCVSGLYAAGECACVSVHGSNRLGGNALPELIVFGARAGHHAAGRDMGEALVETGPSAAIEHEDDLGAPVEPGALGPADDDVAADGGTAADGGELLDPAETVDRTVERHRERVARLKERDGRNHAEIRAKLQKAMTRWVNVFREEEGLKKALETIRECREEYQAVAVADPSETFNTDLIHTIETRNLIDIAETITLGALARDEFRGAHWRAEHQERKDDEWLKHTMVQWNEGSPELYYTDVILEGADKTYEPKVRSY
jgi:succinate dehydrogenase / fumarate reductase flavoprotein subunit